LVDFCLWFLSSAYHCHHLIYQGIFFSGVEHWLRFSSSIQDGLGKDKLELPIAMVFIAATTVSLIYFSLTAYDTDSSHASLDDWS
jgi:hypothetical protein